MVCDVVICILALMVKALGACAGRMSPLARTALACDAGPVPLPLAARPLAGVQSGAQLLARNAYTAGEVVATG